MLLSVLLKLLLHFTLPVSDFERVTDSSRTVPMRWIDRCRDHKTRMRTTSLSRSMTGQSVVVEPVNEIHLHLLPPCANTNGACSQCE